MRRSPTRFVLLVAAFLLWTSAGTAFAQETHDVHMYIEEVEGRMFPEFFFEPSGLYIEPGDTIRFIADTPHHTVTAAHERQATPHRVPEGVEPFSSPVIPVGETWEYTFEEPGVYDLFCAPHVMFGMFMRVVVGEASGPGAEPLPEEEAGPPFLLLNAPAMDPERIVEEGSVAWADIGGDYKVLPPFLQNAGPPPGDGEAPEGEESAPGDDMN